MEKTIVFLFKLTDKIGDIGLFLGNVALFFGRGNCFNLFFMRC